MFQIIKLIKFVDIVSFIWVTIWILPILSFMSFYNYLWLGCYIYWLWFIFHNKHIYTGQYRQILSIYVIFMSWFSLLCLIFNRGTVFNCYVDISQIIMPYFMYLYYRTRGTKTAITFIAFLLPIILFVTLVTIIELQINPFAARSIYTRGAKLSEASNVGGYIFIYTMLLLDIVVLFYLLKCDTFKKRVFAFSLFAILTYLIFLSNYFTALSLLFISVVALFFCRKKEILKLLIPLALVLIPTYKIVGSTAIDVICIVLQEDGRSYYRLKEIQRSLEGSVQMADDVDTRKEVKELSINTFFEHPITGAIIDSSMDNGSFAPIGMHSNILDTFAIFGIGFGIIFLIMFILPFKQIYNKSRTYQQKLFTVVIGLIFLMLMYNNNTTASMGFMALFVFPVVYDLLSEEGLMNN